MLDTTARRTLLSRILTGAAALAVAALSGCRNPTSMDSSSGSEEMAPSFTGAYAPPAGTRASTATAAAPAKVSIDNFSFTPVELTVTIGQAVTWANHDDVPHTIVATNRAFSSAALDTDQTFAHAFTTPGTYTYFCGIHPHMTGRIIVK